MYEPTMSSDVMHHSHESTSATAASSRCPLHRQTQLLQDPAAPQPKTLGRPSSTSVRAHICNSPQSFGSEENPEVDWLPPLFQSILRVLYNTPSFPNASQLPSLHQFVCGTISPLSASESIRCVDTAVPSEV